MLLRLDQIPNHTLLSFFFLCLCAGFVDEMPKAENLIAVTSLLL